MHRPLSRLIALPFLLLALAVGGCVTDQQVIDQANSLHGQIEPTVVDTEDPELARYVQAVGDRIVNAAGELYEEGKLEGAEDWMFKDVKFHLVASPTLNAFTTGGKHVYLYSQLFEESETEDEFAAVVGHEFGHIIGKHVQSGMRNQYLTLGAAAGAGLIGAALAEDGKRTQTATTVGGLALAGGQVVGLSFGRENEREPDELGFRFYVRAGYDPDQFAGFFQNMIDQGLDGPGGMQGYLSSHPQLSERVQAAQQRAAQVSPDERRRYAQAPIAGDRELASLHRQSVGYTAQAARAAKSQTTTAYTEALAILAAFPACVGGEADGIPPSEQAE